MMPRMYKLASAHQFEDCEVEGTYRSNEPLIDTCDQCYRPTRHTRHCVAHPHHYAFRKHNRALDITEPALSRGVFHQF